MKYSSIATTEKDIEKPDELLLDAIEKFKNSIFKTNKNTTRENSDTTTCTYG